jgi:hypothetical protein
MTMARQAFGDDVSVDQVKCCEQRRRTVPLIVVGLTFGDAGAVEAG